jgi:hypothetical protein
MLSRLQSLCNCRGLGKDVLVAAVEYLGDDPCFQMFTLHEKHCVVAACAALLCCVRFTLLLI